MYWYLINFVIIYIMNSEQRKAQRHKHNEAQQRRRAALPEPTPLDDVVVPIETSISIEAKIAIACSIFACFYMSSYTKMFELLKTTTSIVNERGLPKFNQTLTKDECSNYLVSLSEAIVQTNKEWKKLGYDSQSVPYEHLSLVTVDGKIQIKLKDATVDIPDNPAKLVAWLALEDYGRCSSTTLISWGDTEKVSLDELILIIAENPNYKESFVRDALGMIQMSQTTIAKFEPIDEIFLHESIFDIHNLPSQQAQLYNTTDMANQTEVFIRQNLGNNMDEFTGKLVRIGGTQAVYTLAWLFTNPYGMVLLLIGLFSLPVLLRMIKQSLYRSLVGLFNRPPQERRVPVIQERIVHEIENEGRQLRGGKRKIIITDDIALNLYVILQNLNKIKQLVVKELEKHYPTHPITLKIKEIQTKRNSIRSIVSSAWKRLRGTEKKGGKRKSSTKKRKTNKKYHK